MVQERVTDEDRESRTREGQPGKISCDPYDGTRGTDCRVFRGYGELYTTGAGRRAPKMIAKMIANWRTSDCGLEKIYSLNQ
ncbi:MAG: hypothetical protein QOE46_2433 [Acidobacteriota bacterium]|jgi:hypothetical protein|nr:hypothetical protein [Acidobacteriota bacterium]